jgi:uncharacterized OB-fold protein
MSYNKPLPDTRGAAHTFWKGCKEGRLLIQQCEDCTNQFFYPRIACPNCGSIAVPFEEHSGLGHVYSFTIVHKPNHPGFKEEAPYVVALIELDGGGRMMTNVIECKTEDVTIGMRVEVVFTDVTEETTLPHFKPAGEV